MIFRTAVVGMAAIITPPSIAHAIGVSAPRISNRPKTNSTVETKRALNSGNGTCASSNVLTHLFPALRHKKFAASGKKEQQPDCKPGDKNREPFPSVQLGHECPDR